MTIEGSGKRYPHLDCLGAQLYATINTGSPNGGHKSDTAAGGTWGSADDKWNHQMQGHREKAVALLGGTYVPQQFDGFTDADSRPNAALDYEAAYQGPSWGKSTLWAVNHGAFSDPRMQALIAGEIVMGAATYAIRSSVVIPEEDGWETYKERILNPTGLLANGFARTASASIVPMLIDSALLFTPAGPQFGQARSSGTPTDALVGIPAADQLNSLKDFTRGSLNAAFTDQPFTRGTAKAGVRALAPFGNWLSFAAGFSALTRSLPER
ncbi:hypothetical protein [Paracoccus sp. 22332]|uniref:hypothetical protein n=1 Tax=Paracoccus sp. 22332 TaxID=3453913 RepID=UPI003F82BF6C